MITTSKLSSSLHLVLQYFGDEGRWNGGRRAENKGRGPRVEEHKHNVWGILWTNIYALFIWVQAVKRLLVLLYRDRIWNISKLASSGWYMLRVVSVFADQYRMRRKKMICGFKIKIIIERKKLNSHPMINGKYLKTIIKSYNNKIAISFKNVKDISTKQT